VDHEPDSVLDAVQQLDGDGFAGSFSLRDDDLHCSICGNDHVASTAEVERIYRFEGPSDPDEEAVVYALRCPVCGAGGTLVSSFGPGADPQVADRLVLLDERFRASG
jgi:hypothetical protein